MFHSRTMNNKIDRIHERAFSVQLLNYCAITTKLYKFYHGLSPSIMKNVFQLNANIPYNLMSRSELYSRNPKTVKYGTETTSYFAPEIWY